MSNKYVVLGKQTHFTFDENTNKVWCTHGGWGGTLTCNEDGSCEIPFKEQDSIHYSTFEFTEADSFDEAERLGLIDF